jgi:hypothetical protein
MVNLHLSHQRRESSSQQMIQKWIVLKSNQDKNVLAGYAMVSNVTENRGCGNVLNISHMYVFQLSFLPLELMEHTGYNIIYKMNVERTLLFWGDMAWCDMTGRGEIKYKEISNTELYLAVVRPSIHDIANKINK